MTSPIRARSGGPPADSAKTAPRATAATGWARSSLQRPARRTASRACRAAAGLRRAAPGAGRARALLRDGEQLGEPGLDALAQQRDVRRGVVVAGRTEVERAVVGEDRHAHAHVAAEW